jgi:hypothetical protein
MPRPEIDMEEFRRVVLGEVGEFFDEWVRGMKTDRLSFPMRLTEEDWWDQLLTWMQQGGERQ